MLFTPRKFRGIIQDHPFNPGFMGILFNPFYFARKGLYKEISSLAYTITGRTLDVGCGTKPYKILFPCKEYIGLEIDSPENRKAKNADVFYDGRYIPFGNDYFDSVFMSQVFEHIFNHDELLNEIYRVLKPEGTLLMTLPFVWDEHEQPYDFARYTSFGIKHLLEKTGFWVVEQRKTGANAEVLFQMFNAYLFKTTASRNRSFKLYVQRFFSASFNIMGVCLSKILPRNLDLYLDNIILARKRTT